jgi:hypothetical protein
MTNNPIDPSCYRCYQGIRQSEPQGKGEQTRGKLEHSIHAIEKCDFRESKGSASKGKEKEA